MLPLKNARSRKGCPFPWSSQAHPQNLRCLTSPGTCLLVYAQGHFALIPEISEVSLLLQSHHLGLGQPSPDHLARQAHPHLNQPARNRHSCPSALLSVAPVPTFQKSRKTNLSPFPTKLAWPHGHFSCKLRILGSEALATETQKPQTSQGLLDHGLLPVIKGVGPRNTDLSNFVYTSHLMHGLANARNGTDGLVH